MLNGLNLSRRHTSSSQRRHTTSTQGVARKGQGRKGTPEAPEKPRARRDRTIRTNPKKGMKRKCRVTMTEILEEKTTRVRCDRAGGDTDARTLETVVCLATRDIKGERRCIIKDRRTGSELRMDLKVRRIKPDKFSHPQKAKKTQRSMASQQRSL